jgi:hypothetical protein
VTDLEITRLCAEAMGWKPLDDVFPMFDGEPVGVYLKHAGVEDGVVSYVPLHDDAQAMALVKKFEAFIQPPFHDGAGELMEGWKVDILVKDEREEVEAIDADLNRSICECVAKLKQGEGQL